MSVALNRNHAALWKQLLHVITPTEVISVNVQLATVSLTEHAKVTHE